MQRIKETFGGSDNMTVGIVVVVFALVLLLVLPRIIPGGRFGVSCGSLAHPLAGGNNQSYLSARSQGALEMRIELQRTNLTITDNLVVNLTFVNNGVGAITLFFIPQETLLRNDGSAGLSFEIMRTSDRVVFSERTDIRPPNPQRQQFLPEVLHVLGPRQRCTEQLTFETFRLSDLGLPAGAYTLTAIYRNSYPGQVSAEAGSLATPIFQNQGVYTVQELRSNAVEFTIGLTQ